MQWNFIENEGKSRLELIFYSVSTILHGILLWGCIVCTLESYQLTALAFKFRSSTYTSFLGGEILYTEAQSTALKCNRIQTARGCWELFTQPIKTKVFTLFDQSATRFVFVLRFRRTAFSAVLYAHAYNESHIGEWVEQYGAIHLLVQ